MSDSNEMVTVNLTIKRLYRVRHEDRTAIEVGPGMVKVPRWVANEWKMTPIEIPAPVALPVRIVNPPPKTKPSQTRKKAVKHGA